MYNTENTTGDTAVSSEANAASAPTVPAFREDVVNTLTEADVREYLLRVQKKLMPMFPMASDVSVSLFPHEAPCFLCVHEKGPNGGIGKGHSVSAKTFAEAEKQMLAEFGTVESRVLAKRDEAARLLAEADEIERAANAAGAK